MKQETQQKVTDVGLLILRLGIGAMFAFAYGWGKMAGGTQTWKGLGQAMGNVGITFWPTFWGFCAAFSECVGGMFVMLGVLFRPFCALITIVMIVAAVKHLCAGQGFSGASHAVELGIVMLALIFIGPGRFNVGKFIRLRKRKPA